MSGDISERRAERLDDLADRLDWDRVAETDAEELEAQFDAVAAQLAQGYIRLREQGEITPAHLDAILDALERLDEIGPDELAEALRTEPLGQADDETRQAVREAIG